MIAGYFPLSCGVTRVAETGPREPEKETAVTSDLSTTSGSSKRVLSGALASYENMAAGFCEEGTGWLGGSDSEIRAPDAGTTQRKIRSSSSLMVLVGSQLPMSKR